MDLVLVLLFCSDAFAEDGLMYRSWADRNIDTRHPECFTFPVATVGELLIGEFCLVNTLSFSFGCLQRCICSVVCLRSPSGAPFAEGVSACALCLVVV